MACLLGSDLASLVDFFHISRAGRSANATRNVCIGGGRLEVVDGPKIPGGDLSSDAICQVGRIMSIVAFAGVKSVNSSTRFSVLTRALLHRRLAQTLLK